MLKNNILLFLICNPLIFAILLLFLNNKKYIINLSLIGSLISFFLSIFMWFIFNNSLVNFQFIENYKWLTFSNLHLFFGIDGFSIFFILLTTFLILLCILNIIFIENNKNNFKEYLFCFFILEFFLIVVFSSLNLFIFYIFFESILIPMFFIIGVYGLKKKKIKSNYMFFLYTLIGSLFMLLGILYIYSVVGSLNYLVLYTYPFTNIEQKFLWLTFFLSFAIKVPMLPFHIWLPEAHVEAPTTGSVILAGILLKLGTYGFLRFSLSLFPYASLYYSPFIIILALLGVIYTSLTAIRQLDLKKIIAYASVAHMNLIIIGLFTFNIYGIEGSILQMLTHGFTSSALFFCIGILYNQFNTRNIEYYGGLVYIMPIFSIFFLFFILANIALPGTGNFIGEFLILNSLMFHSFILTFFASTGVILSSIYSLWLYNRVCFGITKMHKYYSTFTDLNKIDLIILISLSFLILFVGLYPNIIFESIHFSSINLLELYKL